MTFSRRDLVRAVAAGLLSASPLFAAAQTDKWPEAPVRFVVPFAPGGGVDGAARMVTERLQQLWGVPTLVENRSGANTIIATDTVLRAPRDGYTFLITMGLTLQLPHLMAKVPFDPLTELVPVGAITVEQLVLVTSPATGIHTFAELLEAVQTDSGRYAFGSFGVGSTSHLVLNEINKAAGVDIIHAPYRGAAPAVQAVLGGEVALALSNLGTVQQHIEAGRLTPLAVTGKQRYRFIPDIPTFSELGIAGFETPSWIGIFAAKGVQQPILEKLGADLQVALASPELTRKINGFGQEAGLMAMTEFQDMVQLDNHNAVSMIRAAGIRLE